MPYDFTGPHAAAERARMQADFGVKVDEQGRQYAQYPGQARRYISPGPQARPADTGGFLRSRPQWDTKTGQWKTPINWGNALALGTGVALTGGALSAAGAFGAAGGASGAASGVLPSTTALPGAASAMGIGGAAAGGGMTLGNILGIGQWAAPVAGNLIASRTASRSARDANATQRAADERQYALEMQRDAQARQQWEAEQQMAAKQWAAQEEERQYRRRIEDEREARRAPYRQMSQQAMVSLGRLLGLS